MWLKSFDLFPKVQVESQRRTEEGGIISVIGLIVGIVLFISETIRASQPYLLEKLEFFQDTNSNLTIYLEVQFFHLKCDQLVFDVSTAAESEQEKQSTGWTTRKLDKMPMLENDEGCAVSAVVDIAQYQSGEMHVALSPHLLGDGQVGITIDEYLHYNASHEIVSLAVGEASLESDGSLSPIDHKSLPIKNFPKKFVPEGGTGRFVYDFNVVPQTLIRKSGEKNVSFLVQCREQDVVTHNNNEAFFALQRLGLPGVFMTMQLSTILVYKVEAMVSWGEYFISILGIIAGTSTVVAFIDSILHETFWKAKLD